jgi:CheY-like chemotaxis protein
MGDTVDRRARSVVVVTDDAELVRVAEEALGRQGFAVSCAAGPVQLVFLVEAEPPDIVLCDLRKAGTQAWLLPEVLRRPTSKFHGPVIGYVAGAEGRRRAVARARFDAALEAPFDGDSFSALAAGLLSEVSSDRGPATIMVVEDDSDLREALAETLEDHGFRCVTAEHGREALDVLRSGQVPTDLVVLDLMMPVLDGWQVLDRMQADDSLRAIPVIVVSAARGNVITALPPSQVRLKKPVVVEQLVDAVTRLLRVDNRSSSSPPPC